MNILKDRKTVMTLLVIILLGLSLRFWVFSSIGRSDVLKNDALCYLTMSQQLVDDGIYGYALGGYKSKVSNAYMVPGYLLFLSAIYKITGTTHRQILITRLLQIGLGAIIVPILVFILVYEIFRRKLMAYIVALFTAIYSTYVIMSSMLLTETLAFTIVLIYFYFVYKSISEDKWYWNIGSGFFFAAEILIRPSMLPLFPLPFIFGFFYAKGKEGKLVLLKKFLMSSIGFAFLMSPWWIRNFIEFKSFILVATGGGDPLLAGTYPDMIGVFKDLPPYRPQGPEFLTKLAIERIKNGFKLEPLKYLWWYTAGKTIFMLKYPAYNKVFLPFYIYQTILHLFIVIIGGLGSIFGSIFNQKIRIIFIYFLTYLGIQLAFIPVNRYMYIHIFLLMVVCALAIVYLFDQIRKRFKGAFV